MAELIRMDRTGHTVVAQWDAADPASVASAERVLRDELDHGLLAIVSTGEGQAEQVRSLPVHAARVILRRPIAGG
jgi:hypothetical protein